MIKKFLYSCIRKIALLELILMIIMQARLLFLIEILEYLSQSYYHSAISLLFEIFFNRMTAGAVMDHFIPQGFLEFLPCLWLF